ncbi:MAG TPA: carboxypeptidase-like regulatory domain-containing protein [Candidatus Solibacter sp.]|nr:carboxypeptidase-like regulatory domain-containing protein [Candidatus Solibacter sp.]
MKLRTKLRSLGTSFGTSLGICAALLGLSLPVCAVEQPGTISGYVRSVTGAPQMGAVVQMLAGDRTFTVFTDAAGHYIATGLLPGVYTLKVSAPSFLPALREKLGVHPGSSLNVNVTLKTLLGMMQLGPMRQVSDDDDWKWTLRSVANRPVMRVFDDPVLAAAEKQDHELRGTLSFFGGSAAEGYGTGSDMSTGFTLEKSIFSDGMLAFSGNVGYGVDQGLPAGAFRAGYSHRLANGSNPSFAVTVQRFAASDPNLHNAALQAFALSAGDDITLGDVVELKFGSELQTIQFLGRVTAFRPYGSADLHLSPNTVLEYDYTTNRPDTRVEKGFDSSPADLSESNPRVSLLNYATKVERAHHQEVSLSHRMGNTNVQMAAFVDRIADPALTGLGEGTAAGGFLLPDLSSGTFSYAGKTLDTSGLRIVLQHKFSSDLTATLDYGYGGVLDLSQPDVPLQNAQNFITTHHRNAVGGKLSGTLPRTHTRWITSYRWVNGTALTPVDMFNFSPGQSDPFLNVFVRQPLPCLSGRIEAMIDLRNLLAQGYVPVLGQDGQTVYLVQSARSVRGGVSFTF